VLTADHMCIRCCNAPRVDDWGLCGHCHWAVRSEIEVGLYELREYLRKVARFEAWLREQDDGALNSP
jgi:hypothetical protein